MILAETVTIGMIVFYTVVSLVIGAALFEVFFEILRWIWVEISACWARRQIGRRARVVGY